MNKNFKKGTTTVGIVCKNGIVLAADKRASAGYFIANKKMDKVVAINDTMAVTMAGLVSDAQLLTKLIRAELNLKELKTGKTPQVKEAANLLGGMLYSNVRRMSMIQSIVGFLLAGVDHEGFHLYELGIDGSVTDCDDYCSDGSGSYLATGVLETLYQPGINVEEGIVLAKKAINAAVQRDLATGDGIDLFTIRKDGVKKEFTQVINKRIE